MFRVFNLELRVCLKFLPQCNWLNLIQFRHFCSCWHNSSQLFNVFQPFLFRHAQPWVWWSCKHHAKLHPGWGIFVNTKVCYITLLDLYLIAYCLPLNVRRKSYDTNRYSYRAVKTHAHEQITNTKKWRSSRAESTQDRNNRIAL